MSSKGSLMFVLHAHLPYVYHPGDIDIVEESWFFEAVVETYIPIISFIENLSRDGLHPSIAISLSPTLSAMLENKELERKLSDYVAKRLKLISKEKENVTNPVIRKTLDMYYNLYSSAEATLDKYNGDLVGAFKQFSQAQLIEIMTTSATHAILPLLPRPEAVRAQMAVAADDYLYRFNKKSRGFWLPECAYEKKLQTYLKLSGFEYTFLEAHALEKFDMGVYSPVSAGNNLKILARDVTSSRDIWSAQFGYPGDPNYREFYRDLGYDADPEYIKPYLGMGQGKKPVGLKYYRITGRDVALSEKQLYDPVAAEETVKKHVEDFIEKRLKQCEEIYSHKNSKPVIIGCYDAELFGHWWFEGPRFLETVIREIRNKRVPLQIVKPAEYIDSIGEPPVFEPEISSWGEKGYFDAWLNESNDSVYSDIICVTDKMISAATRFKNQNLDRLNQRALNQAAREVLLSQASDWPFLIYVNSHRTYAFSRIREHVSNALLLLNQVFSKNIDEKFLSNVENKNSIFPYIDFRVFASASKF